MIEEKREGVMEKKKKKGGGWEEGDLHRAAMRCLKQEAG